jgi:hypothetical protein
VTSPGRVSPVGHHIAQLEVLGGLVDQRCKLLGIVRPSAVVAGHLDGGDDVRANATDCVQLDPLVLGPFLAPLLVVLANKSTRREASGVNGEVDFDGGEGHGRSDGEVTPDSSTRMIRTAVDAGVAK